MYMYAEEFEHTTKISLQWPQVTRNWVVCTEGKVTVAGILGAGARFIIRLLKD